MPVSDGDDGDHGESGVVDLRPTAPSVAESDTRERLVRAAADVFREKGYPGSRVQDIARRAGFTSGALYSHFSSRAELLAEAIAVENSELMRLLSDGLGTVRSATPTELSDTLADYIRLDQSPTDQLLLDGFALCAREPDARVRIGEALRDLVAELVELLDSMPSDPESRLARDPEGVAYLVVSFLSGVAALRVAGLGDLVPDSVAAMLAGFLEQLGSSHDGPVGVGSGRDDVA